MKAVTPILFLDEEGQKFFGEGPCRLLHAVEQTGSLRAAAGAMGMAYTKALKLLRQAEQKGLPSDYTSAPMRQAQRKASGLVRPAFIEKGDFHA